LSETVWFNSALIHSVGSHGYPGNKSSSLIPKLILSKSIQQIPKKGNVT